MGDFAPSGVVYHPRYFHYYDYSYRQFARAHAQRTIYQPLRAVSAASGRVVHQRFGFGANRDLSCRTIPKSWAAIPLPPVPPPHVIAARPPRPSWEEWIAGVEKEMKDEEEAAKRAPASPLDPFVCVCGNEKRLYPTWLRTSSRQVPRACPQVLVAYAKRGGA